MFESGPFDSLHIFNEFAKRRVTWTNFGQRKPRGKTAGDSATLTGAVDEPFGQGGIG